MDTDPPSERSPPHQKRSAASLPGSTLPCLRELLALVRRRRTIRSGWLTARPSGRGLRGGRWKRAYADLRGDTLVLYAPPPGVDAEARRLDGDAVGRVTPDGCVWVVALAGVRVEVDERRCRVRLRRLRPGEVVDYGGGGGEGEEGGDDGAGGGGRHDRAASSDSVGGGGGGGRSPAGAPSAIASTSLGGVSAMASSATDVLLKLPTEDATRGWVADIRTGVASVPARRLGDYEVVGAIGRGASGKVFAGRSRATGEAVAIKMLEKGPLVESVDAYRHALNERLVLEVAGNHPFLLRLTAAFQTGHRLFFVTELCAGGDLFDFLGRRGEPLPERMAKRLVAEIVLALSHLHSLGILYVPVVVGGKSGGTGGERPDALGSTIGLLGPTTDMTVRIALRTHCRLSLPALWPRRWTLVARARARREPPYPLAFAASPSPTVPLQIPGPKAGKRAPRWRRPCATGRFRPLQAAPSARRQRRVAATTFPTSPPRHPPPPAPPPPVPSHPHLLRQPRVPRARGHCGVPLWPGRRLVGTGRAGV